MFFILISLAIQWKFSKVHNSQQYHCLLKHSMIFHQSSIVQFLQLILLRIFNFVANVVKSKKKILFVIFIRIIKINLSNMFIYVLFLTNWLTQYIITDRKFLSHFYIYSTYCDLLKNQIFFEILISLRSSIYCGLHHYYKCSIAMTSNILVCHRVPRCGSLVFLFLCMCLEPHVFRRLGKIRRTFTCMSYTSPYLTLKYQTTGNKFSRWWSGKNYAAYSFN